MNKISLLDLSTSIHGGASYAFTKEYNVLGYHIPYLNAKATKKAAEKITDLSTSIGFVATFTLFLADEKSSDFTKTAKLLGRSLAIVAIRGAVEDFIIDPLYKACGGDLG